MSISFSIDIRVVTELLRLCRRPLLSTSTSYQLLLNGDWNEEVTGTDRRPNSQKLSVITYSWPASGDWKEKVTGTGLQPVLILEVASD